MFGSSLLVFPKKRLPHEEEHLVGVLFAFLLARLNFTATMADAAQELSAYSPKLLRCIANA